MKAKYDLAKDAIANIHQLSTRLAPMCYGAGMTKEQIAEIFERFKTWPEDRQQDAIEILLAMEAMGAGPATLSESERAGVDRGLEDMRNRRFASDENVSALFNRFKS